MNEKQAKQEAKAAGLRVTRRVKISGVPSFVVGKFQVYHTPGSWHGGLPCWYVEGIGRVGYIGDAIAAATSAQMAEKEI